MNLSPHFTLEEMTISEVAVRKGISNSPDEITLERLKATCLAMETVRAMLGPIHVNSGYRSPALNAAIGGVATSAHCLGYAVDFLAPNFGPPLAVCERLKTLSHFDQLIFEFGAWTHLSFDPRNRREVLTIKPGSTVYELGLIGE